MLKILLVLLKRNWQEAADRFCDRVFKTRGPSDY